MTSSVFDRFAVIDTDTHITEPPDVWTSRVSKKWGDRVPHVKRVGAKDVWMIADKPIGAPGAFTTAGYDGTFPEFPDTYEDLPPASYDAMARLEHMDREGIHAQVLYPNVGGFGSGRFFDLREPELMLECVRAYNDFLIEWTGADPSRLVPAMATPFWDAGAAVAEIERCAALGHKAVLACGQPQLYGQPVISHPYWDPIWSTAQDAGLSISFHIGGGDLSEIMEDHGQIGTRANFARFASVVFVDNWRCIADLIFGGVCHRFPKLRFVSVESGAGWLPSMLEMFDWQWKNGDVTLEHPEYDLLPSEYFRRQIYGSFWFENQGLRTALELYPDNLLWETDFPHPTSMSPGPRSTAVRPREYADAVLSDLPESVLRKVLHDNAASLYRLD
jgi:predicted TIM-barrel fold metal-dependent hydrolase